MLDTTLSSRIRASSESRLKEAGSTILLSAILIVKASKIERRKFDHTIKIQEFSYETDSRHLINLNIYHFKFMQIT